MAVYLTEAKSQRDTLIDKIWDIYEIVERQGYTDKNPLDSIIEKHNADFYSYDDDEGFFSTMTDEDLKQAYAEVVSKVRDMYDNGKDEETPSELFSIEGLFDQTDLIRDSLKDYINSNFHLKGKVTEQSFDKAINSLVKMLQM